MLILQFLCLDVLSNRALILANGGNIISACPELLACKIVPVLGIVSGLKLLVSIITYAQFMKLLFFTEARLTQAGKGQFYSADQSFSYQMFRRYLTVFGAVSVVARCAVSKEGAFDESTRVDGQGVNVFPLPYYIGPYEYLIERNRLARKIRNCIDANPDSAIICRVPGMISTVAANYLNRFQRPYGVEVVGDPADVFAPGSFSHPFRAIFKYSGQKNLKAVVKGAAASIYVTKAALQSNYPPTDNSFSTHASNVMLPMAAFVEQAKNLKNEPPYSIIAVGSLSAMYKSPDVAIESLRILKDKGLHVSLKWLGGGLHLPDMITLSEKLGVSSVMTFAGHVGSTDEVRECLDAADLFVLPSRTEGLPRALLEAMARGLPCIGTEIGGIPELLNTTAMVPKNNPAALADTIVRFLTDPELADAQAKRNLQEAQRYTLERLEARRLEFYNYLKGVS